MYNDIGLLVVFDSFGYIRVKRIFDVNYIDKDYVVVDIFKDNFIFFGIDVVGWFGGLFVKVVVD